MNTKKIGDIGVLTVATKLAANGITSSFPIGDSTRYDLILELNGMFARAQVKSRQSKNGFLNIEFTNKSTRRGKVIQKRYHPGEIEAFIVYNRSNDSLYILPLEMLLQQGEVTLRLGSPKNNQQKKLHWATDYENDLGNIEWIK